MTAASSSEGLLAAHSTTVPGPRSSHLMTARSHPRMSDRAHLAASLISRSLESSAVGFITGSVRHLVMTAVVPRLPSWSMETRISRPSPKSAISLDPAATTASLSLSAMRMWFLTHCSPYLMSFRLSC